MAPTVGTRLGPYEVLAAIGAGHSGCSWWVGADLSSDVQRQKRVKWLPPSLFQKLQRTLEDVVSSADEKIARLGMDDSLSESFSKSDISSFGQKPAESARRHQKSRC